MLAVYAVVLLLAVGFVAFRLHGSYREINGANDELARLNESLEQRVTERTNELAGTLTDLKESQVQLVQAEKMSSLGQLVAGISHEINTPLLYLANNAELIQERVGLMRRFLTTCLGAFSIKAEDFPDRAEYQARFVHALKDVKLMLRDDDLEASLAEAEDLTRDSIAGLAELTEMAQSLKDFSRLDRAPIANFDVNNGLDKTLLIAKNIIKHKATVRKFYGEIPEIQCSPSQVNQVFLNIITNAAQAIETQGEIVITTRLHDANRVAIQISDTGCGIPEENLSKIRDPFFTTKEVGTGTGLGLSIVDEIIRSHHGELLGRVGGRQGLGVHGGAADQAGRARPAGGNGNARARDARRGGVADDDGGAAACNSRRTSATAVRRRRQRVLNSMRIMFRRQFDLFLASHGAEALDIVKDKNIDVIVADHRMPRMTGVEVLSKVVRCRRARSASCSPATPISTPSKGRSTRARSSVPHEAVAEAAARDDRARGETRARDAGAGAETGARARHGRDHLGGRHVTEVGGPQSANESPLRDPRPRAYGSTGRLGCRRRNSHLRRLARHATP